MCEVVFWWQRILPQSPHRTLSLRLLGRVPPLLDDATVLIFAARGSLSDCGRMRFWGFAGGDRVAV